MTVIVLGALGVPGATSLAQQPGASAATACTPPRGPGDNQVHGHQMRVSHTSCAVGRRVIICGLHGSCRVGGDLWHCRQSGAVGRGGIHERCSAPGGKLATFIFDD